MEIDEDEDVDEEGGVDDDEEDDEDVDDDFRLLEDASGLFRILKLPVDVAAATVDDGKHGKFELTEGNENVDDKKYGMRECDLLARLKNG
jgi:hypothetical protein